MGVETDKEPAASLHSVHTRSWGRGREGSDGVHTRSWGGGERGVMVCTPGPGEGERGE